MYPNSLCDFPQTRQVSVLLFPPSQTAPKIAQVDCLVRQDSESPEEELHTINWRSLLGQNAAFTSQPVGPREPSSPHPSRLYLAFNDCFAIDGSPVNRCAAQLTEGRSSVLWRGTLVGYRAREPASTLTQFRDVSMDDLSAFVLFLKTYGSSPSPTFMPSSHGPEDVEEERDQWRPTEEPFAMPSGSAHFLFTPRRPSNARSASLRSTPSADFAEARQRELVRDTIREEFFVMRAELRMLLQKEVADQVWFSFLNIIFRGVLAYILWKFVSTVVGYAYYLVFDTWFGCFLIGSSLVYDMVIRVRKAMTSSQRYR